MTKERIELCIFNHININDFFDYYQKYNLVNVYIKVDLNNLSETRKKLIELDYTTRLFIVFHNDKKQEYIYGKLKKQKGVFNEHCKNSVFRNELIDLIDISSNEDDIILTDDENIKKTYLGKRKWIII